MLQPLSRCFRLLYLMKLYIEDECCVWRNALSGPALAVSEVVRDEETVLGTLFHELQTLCPSFNNLVEGECSVLSPAVAGVEDLTMMSVPS